MKIYSGNDNNLAVSTNQTYDKSDIKEKLNNLNNNLNKKFRENAEKEYKSTCFAKSFVTTV